MNRNKTTHVHVCSMMQRKEPREIQYTDQSVQIQPAKETTSKHSRSMLKRSKRTVDNKDKGKERTKEMEHEIRNKTTLPKSDNAT